MEFRAGNIEKTERENARNSFGLCLSVTMNEKLLNLKRRHLVFYMYCYILWFTSSGFRDKDIRKLGFVAKTQCLFGLIG